MVEQGLQIRLDRSERELEAYRTAEVAESERWPEFIARWWQRILGR